MIPPLTPVSPPGTGHSGSSLPSLLSPSGLPPVPRACSPWASVVLSPAITSPPPRAQKAGSRVTSCTETSWSTFSKDPSTQDLTVSPGLSSSRHGSVSEMTQSIYCFPRSLFAPISIPYNERELCAGSYTANAARPAEDARRRRGK